MQVNKIPIRSSLNFQIRFTKIPTYYSVKICLNTELFILRRSIQSTNGHEDTAPLTRFHCYVLHPCLQCYITTCQFFSTSYLILYNFIYTLTCSLFTQIDTIDNFVFILFHTFSKIIRLYMYDMLFFICESQVIVLILF